jgi:hypothetical protein
MSTDEDDRPPLSFKFGQQRDPLRARERERARGDGAAFGMLLLSTCFWFEYYLSVLPSSFDSIPLDLFFTLVFCQVIEKYNMEFVAEHMILFVGMLKKFDCINPNCTNPIGISRSGSQVCIKRVVFVLKLNLMWPFR